MKKKVLLLECLIYATALVAFGGVVALFGSDTISTPAWLLIYLVAGIVFAIYWYGAASRASTIASHASDSQGLRRLLSIVLSHYRLFVMYVSCYIFAGVGIAVGLVSHDPAFALAAGLLASLLCSTLMLAGWLLAKPRLKTLGFEW
jgi:hypothetical protein